ncbi:structural maintenance of chromosome 3 (chondroitin sulfate proteoglycan 6), partial [Pancytospora epiphaga]
MLNYDFLATKQKTALEKFAQMFIRAVHLKNFRSFKTAQTIEFGEKNIIVGKNGSGKSNLLAAIASVFLQDNEAHPQYGGEEGISSVKVDIDNNERRFPLGRYVSLSATWRLGRVEYGVDDRVVTKEEIRGLIENAGLNRENIVMQGRITEISDMTPAERYNLIGGIAGTVRYEECREKAVRSLNEDGEARIVDMLDKIELRSARTEEQRRRQKEYEILKGKKADIEYNLICVEVKELTKEIESMAVNERVEEPEIDENFLDFELKETRERICKKRGEMEELRQYLMRYERLLSECGIDGGMAGEELETRRSDGDRRIVNIYSDRLRDIERRREAALTAHNKLRNDERELYIYLKARKYFDAVLGVTEDVKALETQLKSRVAEMERYKDGTKNKETLKDLIGTRKGLWIREKMYKDELSSLKETEASLSNRILYLGKQSINIYESVKSKRGVHGTVFSLFTVPDEIYGAFEAVTRNSLFWIVVENDEIGTRLAETVEGRATFVALNIVDRHMAESGTKYSVVDDDRLIKLSDSIHCDDMYKNVLDYICRGFYICADIRLGVQLAAQYNINVVSIDGDVVSSKGIITGGYENTQSALRELKQCTAKIGKIERALKVLGGQIRELGERIQVYDEADDDDRIQDNIKAMIVYLEWRIAYMAGGGSFMPPGDSKYAEQEYRRVAERLPTAKCELEQLEEEESRYLAKKEKVDQIIEKTERMFLLGEEIAAERERERSLIERCYLKQGVASQLSGIDAETKRQHKHLLIDKRSALLKKIGVLDCKSVQAGENKVELVHELKRVTEQMKKYYGCDKIELVDAEGQGLSEKLVGLQESKSKIFGFIDYLDSKKEDTFQLTFSMIADNYAEYFKMVSGRSSELVLRHEDCLVDVSVDGAAVDVRSMSGGQRTVMAMCLLFAIQKNDPSPFYIFDEVDAN